jgi:hypothetical protein
MWSRNLLVIYNYPLMLTITTSFSHATNIRLLITATTRWQSHNILTTCNYQNVLTKFIVIYKLIDKKIWPHNITLQENSHMVPAAASRGYPASEV